MKEQKNERKRCPDCRVLLRKNLKTKAELEGIPIGKAGDYEDPFKVIWVGKSWKCPKCDRLYPDKESK